jgi:glyoxylase-like metal-dependent hydrolase (beta-lactamase superfamily II)
MDNATEQLADGVWRIEVGPFINAYLVAANGTSDADGLTLVDCGYARSGPRLVRSIRLLGFAPTAVNHIVLTHWHADHMGSAARFAASSAATRVAVGAGDLAAVRGDNPAPHAGLPREDLSLAGRALMRMSRPGPPVDATPLQDGDTLPYAAGAAVVASPGHTQGHIALLVASAGVLLAGDAVFTLGWVSRGFGPVRSARSKEAATLQRLAGLDFEILAAGHGPPVRRDAKVKLERLAQRASRRAATAA